MMAPRLELDRRTIRMIAISFVLLAGLSIYRLWFAEDPNAPDILVLQGDTMGTTWEIRVAGKGLDERLRRRVQKETEERLAELDGWMSNWNPESEISRFNRHHETTGFPVSHDTAAIVAFAIELGKWSGGAFDITVGPLVSLWGFGSGARIGEPPSEEEIFEAQKHMGARLLRVGRGSPASGGFLRKNDPDVQIDLSAIAKGYGVDHVAGGLFELERENFLVEIGGEVYAAGERPGGGPWRVAIEKPLDDGRAIQSIVELSDQAMATSGDYRIFYLEGDRRVAHTIDPRSGYPVENGPASATIIAGSAAEADAWATTLMVLGDPQGLALARQWKIAAMVLLRSEDGTILEKRNDLFPETPRP
jgi:thiamine biosynthesis lipoprotein